MGVKNGSMTWLKSQQAYLEWLLAEHIIKNTPERVICLGDVFDVRVGVQTHVATFARDWFRRVAEQCPVVIIGGNHDYYSPDTDKYCAIDNVLSGIDGVELVTHGVAEDARTKQIYVPWYMQEEYGITKFTKLFPGHLIFTHADIGMARPKLHTPTFSGHIHFPTIEPNENRYSLGACFPLTFADCDVRGAWVLESTVEDEPKVVTLEQIPNTLSIQFHRYHKWPDDLDLLPPKDYIELYLAREDIKSENDLEKWKAPIPKSDHI